MRVKNGLLVILGILILIPLLPVLSIAQRTGYEPQEFAGRRQALMHRIKTGVAVLFADHAGPGGAHFRQDNDFFYFTGLEDQGAILVMIPEDGTVALFLPRQMPREEMVEGPNLLADPQGREKSGIEKLFPLDYLDEFLARNLGRLKGGLHLRLSPRDTLTDARAETAIMASRRARSHYNDQLSLDNHRAVKFRDRYPQVRLLDLTPQIDAMRLIKSQAEIEILRRNGRISAEAVKQAMLATRPGVFEYELEAAAVYQVLLKGARGPAYPPIVASGPNTCIWHYSANSRLLQEGELVLMDFGADLDYLAMDISRTWPVSGRFCEEQREVYRVVLEVQKACIESYRPGVTVEEVKTRVAGILRAKGIDPRGLEGGFGHGVGLAVHDIPLGTVLAEGMVLAIEPGLYYPEKGFGIRIEDTVLITRNGCEVLTAGVPKEIEEIEALLAER